MYGLGVSFRNMLYNTEVLKPSKFNIPLISVGNLAVGGAGKTPHIEYLIRMLQPYINLAILSRGYNRDTSGFRMVYPQDTALISGDEPLMYSRKYRDVPVAVCESRSIAIPQMLKQFPNIHTILLDDAYQHRAVKPFINILLTQYELPYSQDYLMPSGRLREWRSGYQRADIIIVTKCPKAIELNEKDKFKMDLGLLTHQRLFFSKYEYDLPYHFYNGQEKIQITREHHVLLISAIANSSYLTSYLKTQAKKVNKMDYKDHHNFNADDIKHIIEEFETQQGASKYIITTEKDAVRLQPFAQQLYEKKIPIYVLPIKVKLLFNEEKEFEQLIKERLLEFEN